VWRTVPLPPAGFGTSPAVAKGLFAALTDEIELFIVGLDRMIYHTVYYPSIGRVNWRMIGGPVATAPAVCTWEPGRLDLFAVSLNSTLWHWWSTGGGWAGPEDLGGDNLTSAPAAVSWAPGRIDVFSRDDFGSLAHKWHEGGWSDWEDLGGGEMTTAPTVSSWGPGRLDVFWLDHTTNMFHKWYPASWGGWSGSEFQGGVNNAMIRPEAVSWGNNRIDVFTTAYTPGGGPAAFRLMHKWWQ
jgi:hypothetical protein